MKRYLTFIGDTYYPAGGMDDFIGDFDTIEEASDAINHEMRLNYDAYSDCWWHVYDTETRSFVEKDSIKGLE